MASTIHHPSAVFAGSLASGLSASDFLHSSRDFVCDVPLKALGRVRLGSKNRDFAVTALLKKRRKKHDYPWPQPQEIDPNVKGGVLRYLSPFKPLKEKPKPVILDFEKPLIDLQKKIIDVQKMANDTGLDFSDQIILLENKYQQLREDLYKRLAPIQRVNIARHPNRPTFLDHVFNITDKFVELHGDRAGYDDPAIVTGLGMIDGQRFMFMGHQKGRNTKENIKRNFGMPTPHGYRKALRMMHYADHHGFPIVSFVDTPGAFADTKSEAKGQGEAIAQNLRTMFGLKVPIISVVIGEGGSGGALAIACANKVLMLENGVFFVASPEASAAILYKDSKAAGKAAKRLRITAQELCKLKIADGIIPEPIGGAHCDPYWTSQQIKAAILEAMDELKELETEELLQHRMRKFRRIGTGKHVQEGIPLDPDLAFNFKLKEVPKKTYVLELMSEVERLKLLASNANESASMISRSSLKEMLEKLYRECDYENIEVAEVLGLRETIETLSTEYAEMRNSNNPSIRQAFIEKLGRLKNDLNQKLLESRNFKGIKLKIDMIKEILSALDLVEKSCGAGGLKWKINEKYKEVVNRADLKQKIEDIKAIIRNSGVSKLEELDKDVKDSLAELQSEIKSEFAAALEASGLHVGPPSALDVKIHKYQKRVRHFLDDVVKSTDLKNKIELLKREVAKAGNTQDEKSTIKIKALQQEIKQRLMEAFEGSDLKDEYEKLQSQISESIETSDGISSKGDAEPGREGEISESIKTSRGSNGILFESASNPNNSTLGTARLSKGCNP